MIIGDPLPAAKRLYALAKEMARPVARGWLPLEDACAACINATLSAEREGSLGRYRASDVVKFQRFLLGQEMERENRRRDLAAHHITQLVRPMIALRRHSGALLSEAHGVNGEEGFPLTEEEVNDLVAGEVCKTQAPQGRRRAR